MSASKAGIDRRAFALALAASGAVAPAFARDRQVASVRRVLCMGFDYPNLGAYNIPPVTAAEAASRVARAIDPIGSTEITSAFDDGTAPWTRERLRETVGKWVDTITSNDVAMIYYCGHGTVIQGGFHITTPDPAYVPFQDILERVKDKNPDAIVAFIDACRIPSAPADQGPPRAEARANVVPRFRLGGATLESAGTQQVVAGKPAETNLNVKGSDIALIYSTEIDDEADSVAGSDDVLSAFTKALIKYVGTPVDVMTLFSIIANEVPASQTPWAGSSLHHRVFIAGEPAAFGRGRDAWLNVPN